MTIVGMFKHEDYCENINTTCNVTKINFASTWTPINKKLKDCVYNGELDVSLSDNSWGETDCYYDNTKEDCPSEKCPTISGEPLVLIIVAQCILVGPTLIFLFGLWMWRIYRPHR